MVPPGPENPLGEYALYLGWSAYLIHGTNQPWGIGRRVSSGCIRMYPEDIETLYTMVSRGTRVTVVDQPIKFGWIDGDLYIEVHPSKQQADQVERNGNFGVDIPEGIMSLVYDAAGAQADRLDLSAVLRAGLERRGYPVRIMR
jgi:L,D-transpeptidase ErfK/SrfK